MDVEGVPPDADCPQINQAEEQVQPKIPDKSEPPIHQETNNKENKPGWGRSLFLWGKLALRLC